MELVYILHENIDFERWDKALDQCTNKLVYAESRYLNTMCSCWDAIVTPEYDFIMPVPVKKKWGFRYVPVVPFIQQLGIFSSKPVDSDICYTFTKLLNAKFKLADYPFNHTNQFMASASNLNLILDLQPKYATLFENYKPDLKKDLKKKQESITAIIDNYDIEKSILFFKDCVGNRIAHVKDSDYRNLITLCRYYESKNRLISKAVTGENTVFATAIFIKDEKRIYNIASAINKDGKKIKANHFLFDGLIRSFAESGYILDFEGSDIEGIAGFYKQFGTSAEPYPVIHSDNLPFAVKWIRHLFAPK